MSTTETERTAAGLPIMQWARSEVHDDRTDLTVGHHPRPVALHKAPDASGLPLVSNGEIGADLLRLPAGAGFVPHTHPGHHVLVIVGGVGTITYGGRIYRTEGGTIYLIDGEVPHAVGAISDHVILAIGAPHMAVDAEARMKPVPYREVLAPAGDLECLICERAAPLPRSLHDLDCPHCPCYECLGEGL